MAKNLKMKRKKRINHISFEINQKKVAIIKLKTSSVPCPGAEQFKLKRINFCLCLRQPFLLTKNELAKNSLRELSIGRESVLHLSYLYGLMIRRILYERNSEVLSIELHIENTVSGYYACKFILLEMSVPLRVFSQEEEGLKSDVFDNYHSLIQYLKQFVRNSDSLINPLGRYPNYLSKTGVGVEHEASYLGDGHLTVVIPTILRSETMLLETLESLLESKDLINQLVIVIPESSQLSNVIENFLNKFKSVEILKGSQKGVGYARRLGVEAAMHQYVAFIDDDDIVDPSYLTKLLSAHKNVKNLAAVGTWLNSFGYSKVMIPQFDNLPIFGIIACLPPAGVLMWNREALIMLGNFSDNFDRGFEDFYLTSKACSLNHQVAVLDLPLYNYRRHRKSTSANYTSNFESRMRDQILKERLLDSPEASFEISRVLYRNDPSLYDQTPFYWTEAKDINRVRSNYLVRFIYEKFPYQIRKFLRRMMRAKK